MRSAWLGRLRAFLGSTVMSLMHLLGIPAAMIAAVIAVVYLAIALGFCRPGYLQVAQLPACDASQEGQAGFYVMDQGQYYVAKCEDG